LRALIDDRDRQRPRSIRALQINKTHRNAQHAQRFCKRSSPYTISEYVLSFISNKVHAKKTLDVHRLARVLLIVLGIPAELNFLMKIIAMKQVNRRVSPITNAVAGQSLHRAVQKRANTAPKSQKTEQRIVPSTDASRSHASAVAAVKHSHYEFNNVQRASPRADSSSQLTTPPAVQARTGDPLKQSTGTRTGDMQAIIRLLTKERKPEGPSSAIQEILLEQGLREASTVTDKELKERYQHAQQAPAND
jgi:hypothetical protein